MTTIKWTVSPFTSAPSRQEYSHETKNFYMHARGRGRDAKASSWLRYFDSEQEALEYIRQREANKAEQKRTDQINRCGAELLEALAICVGSIKEICQVRGVPLPSSTIDRAEKVIAKAKGEA